MQEQAGSGTVAVFYTFIGGVYWALVTVICTILCLSLVQSFGLERQPIKSRLGIIKQPRVLSK